MPEIVNCATIESVFPSPNKQQSFENRFDKQNGRPLKVYFAIAIASSHHQKQFKTSVQKRRRKKYVKGRVHFVAKRTVNTFSVSFVCRKIEIAMHLPKLVGLNRLC